MECRQMMMTVRRKEVEIGRLTSEERVDQPGLTLPGWQLTINIIGKEVKKNEKNSR